LGLKNAKIIIPGGAGFVGRNLVKFLAGVIPAENITVIDKSADHLQMVKKYGVKTVEADLSEKGTWYDLFSGQDVIIHLAAQISSLHDEDFQKNNVRATENIIEAAKAAAVSRIIFFSSAAVLSVRKDPYADTKLQAQELVRQSGLTYCIIQPSLMYGPTDDKNIGYLINFAKKMPVFPIPGHGRWPRQPIYIDDICRMILHFLDEFPENKVYPINGKVIFYKDMINTVFRELGGFKMSVSLPIPVFKFLMVTYQKLIGNQQFTTDQVDSLSSCDVFPEYPWWDEFHIPVTPFNEGVRQMLQEGK
jgi:nucleoside-diphosphate-sugar epimerase